MKSSFISYFLVFGLAMVVYVGTLAGMAVIFPKENLPPSPQACVTPADMDRFLNWMEELNAARDREVITQCSGWGRSLPRP